MEGPRASRRCRLVDRLQHLYVLQAFLAVRQRLAIVKDGATLTIEATANVAPRSWYPILSTNPPRGYRSADDRPIVLPGCGNLTSRFRLAAQVPTGARNRENHMTDDSKPASPQDDKSREKADKAATEPGPSDKQGEAPKPGPAEQQPT